MMNVFLRTGLVGEGDLGESREGGNAEHHFVNLVFFFFEIWRFNFSNHILTQIFEYQTTFSSFMWFW